MNRSKAPIFISVRIKMVDWWCKLILLTNQKYKTSGNSIQALIGVVQNQRFIKYKLRYLSGEKSSALSYL